MKQSANEIQSVHKKFKHLLGFRKKKKVEKGNKLYTDSPSKGNFFFTFRLASCCSTLVRQPIKHSRRVKLDRRGAKSSSENS